MSGTSGPLVCGKCGKMLAIDADAGAAVCVLCGFSRSFKGASRLLLLPLCLHLTPVSQSWRSAR